MIRVYNISSVLGALHRWVEVMVVHVIHHDWHKQCSQRVQALFCMRGPTDCMQGMCVQSQNHMHTSTHELYKQTCRIEHVEL